MVRSDACLAEPGPCSTTRREVRDPRQVDNAPDVKLTTGEERRDRISSALTLVGVVDKIALQSAGSPVFLGEKILRGARMCHRSIVDSVSGLLSSVAWES
jgi:hypothetical protein